MMNLRVPFILLVFFLSTSLIAQMEHYGIPFIAHAHNDYLQEHPLTTALNNNFSSIEIDFFEHHGNIVVAHDNEHLDTKPEIDELYLKRLFENDTIQNELILLLDIKQLNPNTLRVLHQTFEKYKHHLLSINKPTEKGKVQLILSGDLPPGKLSNTEEYEYFFIDGRIEDLKNNQLSKRTAMISSKFSKFTKWRGKGRIKEKGLREIIAFVSTVKSQNIRVRFWDTQDNKETWNFLLGLRVDVIGVDNIPRFTEYLDF